MNDINGLNNWINQIEQIYETDKISYKQFFDEIYLIEEALENLKPKISDAEYHGAKYRVHGLILYDLENGINGRIFNICRKAWNALFGTHQ